MTTHHMDEAQVLGDRMTIMSQGQVKCLGTVPFLKQAFGEGYLLRLSIIPDENKVTTKFTTNLYELYLWYHIVRV